MCANNKRTLAVFIAILSCQKKNCFQASQVFAAAFARNLCSRFFFFVSSFVFQLTLFCLHCTFCPKPMFFRLPIAYNPVFLRCCFATGLFIRRTCVLRKQRIRHTHTCTHILNTIIYMYTRKAQYASQVIRISLLVKTHTHSCTHTIYNTYCIHMYVPSCI